MNRRIIVEILSIFLAYMPLNAVAVFYTVCSNAASMSFFHEPFYTGSCKTALLAASMCSKDINCAMFSKNGSMCAFFTKGINSMICEREVSDDFETSYFSTCDCKFEPDPWTKVGPLYLHMTPEKYTCNQGQAVCSSFGGTMVELYTKTEMDNAYSIITDSVFVGINYTSGKYVWQTTGLEVRAELWATGPIGEPCVQLWIRYYGLDDTKLDRYKHVLCEKRIS